MVSSMGTMDMSMSHDCHNGMSSDMADMEVSDHCESAEIQHEACDSKNCGACVYHCTSAIFTSLKSPSADESPLLEIRHLLGDTHSLQTRLLRPPKSLNS